MSQDLFLLLEQSRITVGLVSEIVLTYKIFKSVYLFSRLTYYSWMRLTVATQQTFFTSMPYLKYKTKCFQKFVDASLACWTLQGGVGGHGKARLTVK